MDPTTSGTDYTLAFTIIGVVIALILGVSTTVITIFRYKYEVEKSTLSTIINLAYKEWEFKTANSPGVFLFTRWKNDTNRNAGEYSCPGNINRPWDGRLQLLRNYTDRSHCTGNRNNLYGLVWPPSPSGTKNCR